MNNSCSQRATGVSELEACMYVDHGMFSATEWPGMAISGHALATSDVKT